MKLTMKLMLMFFITSSIMVATSCKKDPDPVLPTVATGGFVAKADGTATGTGNEVTDDGNADVTDRGVVYGGLPNPVIGGAGTSTVKAGSGVGVFNVSLQQLAPKFTYHVRAYATNSQGTAYGADVEFTVP